MTYTMPSRDQEQRADTFTRVLNDARQRARDRSNAHTADLVGQIRAHYPQLQEGDIVAAARAGLRPSHPLLARMAHAREDFHKEEGNSGGWFGDLRSKVSRVLSDPVGAIPGRWIAKGALRSAFTAVDAPVREFVGRAGEVLTGTGEALARAGTVLGTGAGAVVGGALGTLALPGVGTAGGAALGAGLGGALGGFLGDVAGGGETTLYSPGAIAAQQLLNEGRADLGQGFFPGGEAHELHVQRMRQLGEAAGLDGSFTLGRFGASKVGLSSGSLPYNVVSGLIDLGVIVKDPASIGLKSAGAGRAARRTFEPVEDVGQRFGLVHGHRGTTVAEKFEAWHLSNQSPRYYQQMAEMSPAEVFRVWTKGGRNPNAVPLGFVEEIGRLTDPDDVANAFRKWVVDERSLTAIPRHLSGVSGTVRQAVPGGWSTSFANKRIFGRTPGEVIYSTKDPNGSVANLEHSLRNALVPVARRNEILNDAINSIIKQGDFEQRVIQLSERGLSLEGATRLAGDELRGRKSVYQVFVREYPEEVRRGLVAKGHGITADRKDFIEHFGLYMDKPGVAAAVRTAEKAGKAVEPGAVYDDLIAGGHADVIDATLLDRLTTLWTERLDFMKGYWVEEYGKPVRHSLTTVDDSTTLVQHSPHAFVEMMVNEIPNLDWRQIRRSISNPALRSVLSKNVDGVLEPRAANRLLDAATREWKPWAVARPAYIMRVTGMIEQARLAVDGSMSLFNHPVRAMRWIMHRTGDKDFAGRAFPKAWGKPAKELEEVDAEIARLDEKIRRSPPEKQQEMFDGPHVKNLHARQEALREELNRRAAENFRDWQNSQSGTLGHAVRGDVLQRRGNHVPVNMGEYGFEMGVAQKVALLSTDPVYRHALSTSMDEAVEWFLHGEGKTLRLKMGNDPAGVRLLDESVARQYIEEVYPRLKDLTGEDPKLMSILREGKGGVGEDGGVAKGLLDHVHTLVREGTFRGTPTTMVDEAFVNSTKAAKDRNALHKVRDFLVDKIVTVPTNVASRSPHFRLAYWRWMARNADALAPGAIDDVLRIAGETGVPRDLVSQARARAAKGSGRFTAEEADVLASSQAATAVGDLLWDFSRKGQFFDVWRVAFPFGDAWKEELTVWSRLINENPQIAQRFQQGIKGLRSQGLVETVSQVPVLGMGIPTNVFDQETGEFRPAGFFHVNSTGEEVFTYPLTGWLSEKLTGHPIPLTGRVQGLTMVAEVLPGIGPAMQLPLSWIVANEPGARDLNELLFPFGRPEMTSAQDIAEPFVPAWVQRAFTAIGVRGHDSERIFTNSINSAAAYLVSSGEYEQPSTPEEASRLHAAATDWAKGAWLLRAGASLALPASPGFDWQARDHDGMLISAELLRQEMRHFQEHDPENADARFAQRHGPQAFLHVTHFSRSQVYGAPVTRQGVEWADSHRDVKKAMPQVYGLFAPIGGDFIYDEYVNQFRTGERQQLTFDQWVQVANVRLARNVIAHAQHLAGPNPSPQVQANMRRLKYALAEEYYGYWPGFGGGPAGVASKVPPAQAIDQVRAFERFPELRDAPVGEALRTYLHYRDIASSSGTTPTTFTTAKGFLQTRTNLRLLAHQLMSKTPEFGAFWDQLFERELADDFEEG